MVKNWVLPRNHRFFFSFERVVKQIVPSGIISHFYDEFRDLFNAKQYSHYYLDKFEKMSLEHLEAGFFVWLASLFFPLTAFIAELVIGFKLVNKLSNHLRKTKRRIVTKYSNRKRKAVRKRNTKRRIKTKYTNRKRKVVWKQKHRRKNKPTWVCYILSKKV